MGVLNSQLASALGRPDLAFAVQMRPASVQAVPAGFNSTTAPNSDRGEFSGPVLALAALIVGYAAFVYWVHPHLA